MRERIRALINARIEESFKKTIIEHESLCDCDKYKTGFWVHLVCVNGVFGYRFWFCEMVVVWCYV